MSSTYLHVAPRIQRGLSWAEYAGLSRFLLHAAGTQEGLVN